MAAERKLKGEIDRTLKKVQEGQDLFEELWVQVGSCALVLHTICHAAWLKEACTAISRCQVHECDNSNQQRLREQIKSWWVGRALVCIWVPMRVPCKQSGHCPHQLLQLLVEHNH
jgi:CCR4-NOT transcription complex subunit 3